MMRARDAGTTFVRVCARRDVGAKAATILRAGRHDVAIFEVAGQLRAYENCCPHQGGPIGEGIVEGETVTCPWHAWCFDVATGRMTLGDFARVDVFEVQVEGSIISISSEPRT